MKQTLTLFLVSFMVATTFGWTYHHSRGTMNWTQARQWCQSSYTDMVVIQSQKENDYLVSKLPTRGRSPYYWIGITKRNMNESWTWIGNNSTWISEQSWAENEPNNNDNTEFCVEIYVNNRENRGKWNDEKCSSKKYAVCFKAQCNSSMCVHGQCQETIENTTCLCEAGYVGDRCETAITTGQTKEESIDQQSGAFSVTESGLESNTELKAITTGQTKEESIDQQSGAWSVTWSGLEPNPKLKAVECPPLSRPDSGYLSCSGENNSFNITCQFKCYPGFMMEGPPNVTCGPNGDWSGPRPMCTVYKLALLGVLGCGALLTICCIALCYKKHRNRKKLAQLRESEEATVRSS